MAKLAAAKEFAYMKALKDSRYRLLAASREGEPLSRLLPRGSDVESEKRMF